MSERIIRTAVQFGKAYFSVEPDEEKGTMEFFAERRNSDEEDEDCFVTTLTLDEMEYLAKRILDAVELERKQLNE